MKTLAKIFILPFLTVGLAMGFNYLFNNAFWSTTVAMWISGAVITYVL